MGYLLTCELQETQQACSKNTNCKSDLIKPDSPEI